MSLSVKEKKIAIHAGKSAASAILGNGFERDARQIASDVCRTASQVKRLHRNGIDVGRWCWDEGWRRALATYLEYEQGLSTARAERASMSPYVLQELNQGEIDFWHDVMVKSLPLGDLMLKHEASAEDIKLTWKWLVAKVERLNRLGR